MKSRHTLFAVLILALAFSAAGCGKKETSENAPAPEAAAAATPIDMATVGSVAGSVKLDGAAPKAKPINMAAEPSCASMHTTPQLDESVLVGDGNSLANVVVYVSDGLGSRTFDAPKTAATIDQKGCHYVPHVLGLMAGQPISVTNSDKTTHNIHPVPQNNREWNKSQPPGAPAIEEVFGREEIAIPVKCNVHPWMKSYVAVFKHPYFFVTDKDGKFEIKSLPPGSYTLTAWHEKYGASAPVSVTIGAKEAKTGVAFTFKAASGD